MNDELFERLAAIDPHPRAVPVDAHDGPRARILRETIMTTPTDTTVPNTAGATQSGTRGPASRRRLGLIGGGAAAAAVAGVIAVNALGGSPAATSVTYTLGASDPMAMCLQLSEFTPDPATVAFGGTVASIEGTQVVVEVDRWYANGDADQVVLDTTGVPSPALDGVEFTEGQDVLVSVFGGAVGFCGASGAASPELEAFYEEWFGA